METPGKATSARDAVALAPRTIPIDDTACECQAHGRMSRDFGATQSAVHLFPLMNCSRLLFRAGRVATLGV